MKEVVRTFVLKNAFDFNGSVNSKAVLGLVLRENPELKKDVPSVLKEINEVIKEVEKLSHDEIKQQLERLDPTLTAKKKEKKEGPLKELPHAQNGKVVVRIAPSPSGALHIGHAYGASLNYEYAKMYDGKFILRIEDTNPENIYGKGYELIEEDVRWLAEGNVTEVVIQSDDLGKYYDVSEKLVEQGNAYVCTCNADAWRELKNDGKACPCRELGVKEHQTRYANMFSDYAEGEAVLRLRTDIQDKNPAMRDFPIMRINEHIHPRTKKEHKVWPLMVLSVTVDDHNSGVTHVLNGKDHTDNAKKETMIMHMLKWKPPQYKHWGRINFTGMKISSSETRIAIEQNEYSGWDDIRLPFLPALRRRGYQPEAFRKFAIEVGLSLNDKTVSKEEFWKHVNAFNKELVEPTANRYFFVDEPHEISIRGYEGKTIEIPLHPDFAERGMRTLETTQKFLIAESDFKQLGEGYLHRLMDCCNFKLEKNKFVYVSDSYEEFKHSEEKGKIIHWVPAEKNVPMEVIMDDGRVVVGVSEEAMECVTEGNVVQLERRFFGRVDTKGTIYYLHT